MEGKEGVRGGGEREEGEKEKGERLDPGENGKERRWRMVKLQRQND